jgi:hypothetical protein
MAVNNSARDSALKAFRFEYMKLRLTNDPKKKSRYQDYLHHTLNAQLDPVLNKFLVKHWPITYLHLQEVSLGNKV